MLDDLRIKDFLDDLGSSLPAPGGGSVAALSTALAGALNSMVFSLTVGKKAYNEFEAEVKEEVQKAFEESKKLYKEATDYMEKDKEVFLKVMSAYKLPKANDEEKDLRHREIQNTLLSAMGVPFDLMKLSVNFYGFIEVACKYGNRNAISDAGVAAIMLHAAIESAYLNVKINAASIDDKLVVNKVLKECEIILEASREKKEYLLKEVYELI